jgi:hypothetical protein
VGWSVVGSGITAQATAAQIIDATHLDVHFDNGIPANGLLYYGYPALFTKAGENWRQFPDFPLLATEELDYLPRHMRHPLGETPPAQPIGWLF